MMSSEIYSQGSLSPSIEINSLLPINSPDDLYTAPDGSEWLRTGTVAQDTAGDYPDATTTSGVIGVSTASTEYSVPVYTRIK